MGCVAIDERRLLAQLRLQGWVALGSLSEVQISCLRASGCCQGFRCRRWAPAAVVLLLWCCCRWQAGAADPEEAHKAPTLRSNWCYSARRK